MKTTCKAGPLWRAMLARLGLVACVAAAGARAETDPADEPPTARARNKAAVQALHEQHLAEHGADPDMMIRPGLLADRQGKTVRIWAEAVAMNTDDPVEFLLIAENSGKDYEALAVSLARPLDIHRALEFIGMRPGRPVDYAGMRLWPKAERVIVTCTWNEPAPEAGKPALSRSARAEQLIVDVRTKKTLPPAGFAFTGSRWVDAGDGSTQKVYAADAFDPLAIISDYNEPLVVLDVPRRAVDGLVYGFQKVNPDCRLPPDGLIEILMEPEYKDGKVRVADLVLRAAAREGTRGASLPEMRFALETTAGKPAARGNDLKHVLAAFGRLTKDGRDPFVTVHPDPGLSLEGVRALYAFLAGIATDEGIRLEPPAAGDLFFKSFLPDEAMRRREERPTQPWELRLAASNGVATARLLQIEEQWPDDAEKPILKIVERDVAGPEALREILQAEKPSVPVVLVFAPATLRYGDLRSFAEPLMAAYPTVYVFLEPDNKTP